MTRKHKGIVYTDTMTHMTSDLTSYSGQNILVTGAFSGIGAAAADLIESRGGRVFRLDIQDVKKPDAKKIDMGDQASVNRVVKEILSEVGEIHAVVNSAGIAGPTSTNTEDVNWSDFLRTITIDLFGSIWLTQAVLPSMKAKKYGRIVHIASIAGKEGNPGMSPYNTAKAGLIGYVKGVAKETATTGITINAIAPAVIRTPINETVTEEIQKYMVSRIPVGRLGEPTEVAELIAFAASKACSFTTGFTFDISGGRATY
jgi:2-dehydro-3-deoxy-L-rhamnonate dehydrogenase (NAD+)